MRTNLSVLLFLAAMTTTAAAHPPLAPAPQLPSQRTPADGSAHIDLPSADSFLYRRAHREDSEGLTFDNARAYTPPAGRTGPSIDIGSFHAELGGAGSRVHLAHYTLEGVRVMGGTVSGSIDGKSARITIDW